MNKSEKEVITQVIENLINLRDKQFHNSVINRIDLHFYKDEVKDIEVLDNNFESLGITDDDMDEVQQLTRPSEEELKIQSDKQIELFKQEHQDLWNSYISDYDTSLVKLNNLLEKKDKNQSVIDIEIQMTKINMKTHITPTEFSIKYNVSKSTQQEWRCQRKDPLPYNQKVVNGNILYVVKEVDQWFKNQ